MNLKKQEAYNNWRNDPSEPDHYSQIDPQTLKLFSGTHPRVIQEWLPREPGLFQADPNYRLTARERKHRIMLRLERWLGVTFHKNHYRSV